MTVERIASRLVLIVLFFEIEMPTGELLLEGGMMRCTGVSSLESATGSVCTPVTLVDSGTGVGDLIRVGVQLIGVFDGEGAFECVGVDAGRGTDSVGRNGDGVGGGGVTTAEVLAVSSIIKSPSISSKSLDDCVEFAAGADRRFLFSFFSKALNRLASIIFSIGSQVLSFAE